MPYAAECQCDRPLTFSEETCSRCGKPARVRVTASTMRLAVAIAEVALGRRPLGDRNGGHARRSAAQRAAREAKQPR